MATVATAVGHVPLQRAPWLPEETQVSRRSMPPWALLLALWLPTFVVLEWRLARQGYWQGGLYWLPMVAFTLFLPSTLRRRLQRHLPALGDRSVFVFRPAEERALQEALSAASVELRVLEGSAIASTADLARALDSALGPFRFPEDSTEKIRAHIQHERRGSGAIAILWRNANVLRSADATAFVQFTTDWEHAMSRRGVVRLLLLDLAPAC